MSVCTGVCAEENVRSPYLELELQVVVRPLNRVLGVELRFSEEQVLLTPKASLQPL